MSKVQFAILGTFILIASSSIGAFSQKYTKKEGAVKDISINTNNASIIPGVIILKLKPEFDYLAGDLNALLKSPHCSTHVKQFKVSKFGRMFPVSNVKKGKPGALVASKSIDISLIHYLYFDTKFPVAEVIKHVIESGLVEYAEPQYVEGLLYLPSDPLSQPTAGQSLLLERINAYKAWDIEKGDPSVVIGVLDTGTELTHPDLINTIAYNLADPIGGGDDDGDGYIDNYYGWDMGSNDNDPTWQVANHGVGVQGSCSATADNGIGLAGTGFNCKSLPIKISNSSGYLTAGYEGIVYAANHGVKVMNISWGGFGSYSQASQDIINYAVSKDVLIVAAGGNTEGNLDFYPASYDSVLSVSGIDTVYSPLYDTLVERRRTFPANLPSGMSYSFHVDLSSMEGGVSTASGSTYKPFGGSSFAAPTTAGAAALVRSRYPLLKATQAAEMLRVTGDILDTFDVTRPESRYKTGRKLNMYKALTTPTTPSVRMKSYSASTKYSAKDFFNGDTITITNNFFNHLSKTTNLTIRMLCSNGFGRMVDSISYLGQIDSFAYKANLGDPFKIVVGSNAGLNQLIDVVLIMTDPSTDYYDYLGFTIAVNPSTLSLDTNLIKTTITSIGRIGYNDNVASVGLGVNYLNNALLYESGFMIGTSISGVSDCVRNTSSADDEFKPINTVHYLSSTLKDEESFSVFNDSLSSSILGVEIEQKSYEWESTPNDKFAIVEYKITNQSANTYDSIFAGIFADWDIANYVYNRADWDDGANVSYTYSTEGGTKVAGIALLTDNIPSCYSMDNSGVGGANINPNDGFTTVEKFNTLAKGVYRKQAGATGFGNDVSQVTAAKILNFTPGKTETVAFAIIAADNVFELLTIAQTARDKFVSIKQGALPVAPNVVICRNDTIDITVAPTSGNDFAFFTSPPPALPFATGKFCTIPDVYKSDTLYIANKDSLFYSAIKSVYFNKDNMKLNFYPSADTIVLPVGGELLLVNQSTGTASISWDLGDGNFAIGSSVSHQYDAKGYYAVKLIGVSPMACNDTLTRILSVGNITDTKNSIRGIAFEVLPNPVSNDLTIQFSGNQTPEYLSIELINALGSTIYSSASSASPISIDMSSYASGIYFVKLVSGNSAVMKKIIKK